MPKPWARIELGYLNHPKFLALNANAICLWHEGKNYCDTHHTDGLVPRDALKTFRFRGTKAIAMLLASCGQKPDGTPYAALWEEHAVGYKMHDYLEYNDCRDSVLARMGQAEERREAERERKAEWRARKKDIAGHVPVLSHGTNNGTATGQSRSTTETETPTETKKPPNGGYARARGMAPIHDKSHVKHAFCGRVCMPAPLFDEFIRRRNSLNADSEILDWAIAIDNEWADGGRFADVEPGSPYDFWKARYAEKWPAPQASKTDSRLPKWALDVQARKAQSGQ